MSNLYLQGPKGDVGEIGPPGDRGEKGEMGLSGPAVSRDSGTCFSDIQPVKST